MKDGGTSLQRGDKAILEDSWLRTLRLLPTDELKRHALTIVSTIAQQAATTSFVRVVPCVAHPPTRRQPLRIELDLNSIQKNVPCMHLMVSKRRRGVDLEIESLRFSYREQECDVSGSKLLSWVLGLRTTAMVRSIELTDAASKAIPGTSIRLELTRYRKLATGVGWYEQYGFFSRSEYQNHLFQESFRRMRHAPASHVARLLWEVVRHFLRPTATFEIRRLPAGAPSSALLDRLMLAISRLNPVVPMDRTRVKRVLSTLTGDVVHGVADFLVQTSGMGLPKEDFLELEADTTLTPALTRSLAHAFDSSHDRKSCTCFYRAATPPHMRTQIEKILGKGAHALAEKKEIEQYMQGLDAVLALLQALDMLIVPIALHYFPRRKPPRGVAAPCTPRC